MSQGAKDLSHHVWLHEIMIKISGNGEKHKEKKEEKSTIKVFQQINRI